MKHILITTVVFFILSGSNLANLIAQNKTPNPKTITIDAKPYPLTVDITKTGVIVVDMQNDFGSKGGMFDLKGNDISSIRNTIGPTSKVLASARKSGIKVIYLKGALMPDLSDLGDSASPYRRVLLRAGAGNTVTAPDGSKSRIQIRDTWNTDIIDELKPEKGDIVIYKSRYSGFYKTELDSILKKLNIKYLIFTGCTTSVCVESTVRDATFRDYAPLVLEDCTAEPIGQNFPRSNKEASLLIMRAILGWVSMSDNVLEALGSKAK